jgi:hypothetical protein
MDTATRYTWKFRFVLLALAVAWGSFQKSESLATRDRVERTLTAGATAPVPAKAGVRTVSETARRAPATRPLTLRTRQTENPRTAGGVRIHSPAATAGLPSPL